MRSLILLFGFLGLFSCKKDKKETLAIAGQPNILLIIADDVGIDASPGYAVGSQLPKMPNLEKLMSEGLVFDNAWSFPVCSPTRASILTGKYGVHTGVLNATNAATIGNNELSIQRYLDNNTGQAYAHSIFGKWHLSNNANSPTALGVGTYAGILRGAVPDYFNWTLTKDGKSNISTEYCTSQITDMAMEWIEAQTKPWFCWLGYTAAHTPLHLPPDSMHSQGALPSDSSSVNANPIPYFLAMIESIDFELGRILNSLSATERANTVVIYIGDNGTSRQVLQGPYRPAQSKGSLYQGGIHVPLVVSGYGVERKGERETALINSADLFTTISEIAGVETPVYENSYSFKPLLYSAIAGKRKYNYSEVLSSDFTKSGYTIRDSQYKLIVFDDGMNVMYDLLADAYESTNLLNGTLTAAENDALLALQQEAQLIRN